MAKFKYAGSDERVFPTIGVVVEAGAEFDAPDDFAAHDVVKVKKSTPSAASDSTEGE